jgi:hypothetical protein
LKKRPRLQQSSQARLGYLIDVPVHGAPEHFFSLLNIIVRFLIDGTQ